MPAFVSLAFALPDSLPTAVERVRTILPELELCEAETGEDLVDREGELAIAGARLRAWLRAYQQVGWTAFSVDVEEEELDRVARAIGRPVVVAALVELGARIVRVLLAPYVHVEEEAEADHDPRAYTGAEPLFGVTLLRADLPEIAVALATPGLLRIDRTEGVVALWRRADPVPHRCG